MGESQYCFCPHNAPILTANPYGHIELIDKAAAVKPKLAMGKEAKTGTADDCETTDYLGPNLGPKNGAQGVNSGNLDETAAGNKNAANPMICGGLSDGGERRIRTFEGIADRFTVCSH